MVRDGGTELACSARLLDRGCDGWRRRRWRLPAWQAMDFGIFGNIYVAGQGGQALLRIGHHLAYPVAARFQLKGHVEIDPGFEKLRQLSISNIYGCVPLLGSQQISFLIEDAKNKGQRIEVMVRFFSEMERFGVHSGRQGQLVCFSLPL